MLHALYKAFKQCSSSSGHLTAAGRLRGMLNAQCMLLGVIYGTAGCIILLKQPHQQLRTAAKKDTLLHLVC
jgi:hypothetical protein